MCDFRQKVSKKYEMIGESDAITQRTKVYYRYLQNNPIEGWELDRYGNEIYLDKII